MKLNGTTYEVDVSPLLGYNDKVAANQVFDLTKVYEAEARRHELSFVNRERAQELSHAMGIGRSIAAELFVRASTLVNIAANAMSRREAVIILDEARGLLESKGLVSSRSPGGSADFRTAVVNDDPEYNALRNLYEQLRALKADFQIKMQDLERYFFAVQNVYKTPANFGLEDNHQDLSGTGNSGSKDYTDNEDDGFFGKARY